MSVVSCGIVAWVSAGGGAGTKLPREPRDRNVVLFLPGSTCMRIEDYALIGDCETGALIGRDGSIDWLCWPRFDSGACFAALLGGPEHGRWRIAPARGTGEYRSRRRYRGDTMILETEIETADGAALVIDFMPVHGENNDLV